LLISFGSGIPGVGVAPFGAAFILTFFGSGMPGVVPVTGKGVVESPGGSGWFAFAFVIAAFAFALVLVSPAEPQARLKLNAEQKITKRNFLDIKKYPHIFRHKNSCAGLNVASPGDGDGVQTGTGRYQTDFGRYIFVADMGEQLQKGL
jgi:hypothetical protein